MHPDDGEINASARPDNEKDALYNDAHGIGIYYLSVQIESLQLIHKKVRTV